MKNIFEIFKPKQNGAEPDKEDEVGMVNNDQVHEEAGKELVTGVAEHTGQTPEEVIPVSAQSPLLEEDRSGVPKFKELPKENQKSSPASQISFRQSTALSNMGVVPKLTGQGVRDIQRGLTGEHIEEPASFQPAKPALDLNSRRTLKKAA